MSKKKKRSTLPFPGAQPPALALERALTPAVAPPARGASPDSPAAHGTSEDDPITRRLLATYGTNERRQRTCRVLGRGLFERQRREVLAHEIKKITVDFGSGEDWQDDFCTALVEVEYGDFCCKSWGWLLIKVHGHPEAREPFECVELGTEDDRLLELAMRRMLVVEAAVNPSHG